MKSSKENRTTSPPPGAEADDAGAAHDGDRHDGERHGGDRSDGERHEGTSGGSCLFCRLAGEMERRLDRHAEVFEHLAGAQREVLQAVRSFVDTELDSLEDRLRRHRERRDAPARVTRIDVD